LAVIDAGAMAQTFAAVACVCRNSTAHVPFYGVVANRVGARAMLKSHRTIACRHEVFGALRATPKSAARAASWAVQARSCLTSNSALHVRQDMVGTRETALPPALAFSLRANNGARKFGA